MLGDCFSSPLTSVHFAINFKDQPSKLTQPKSAFYWHAAFGRIQHLPQVIFSDFCFVLFERNLERTGPEWQFVNLSSQLATENGRAGQTSRSINTFCWQLVFMEINIGVITPCSLTVLSLQGYNLHIKLFWKEWVNISNTLYPVGP